MAKITDYCFSDADINRILDCYHFEDNGRILLDTSSGKGRKWLDIDIDQMKELKPHEVIMVIKLGTDAKWKRIIGDAEENEYAASLISWIVCEMSHGDKGDLITWLFFNIPRMLMVVDQ